MKPAHALGHFPHLFVKAVSAAISFYHKAFGALELLRNVLPDGTVLFVESAVGEARLLISEEIARRAVFAGATVEAPVQEMFFSERYGRVIDPDGHRWALTTKREDLTPDDIDARTPPEV
jgi:uncharacterized glyoxalase superfamily protein PhnB